MALQIIEEHTKIGAASSPLLTKLVFIIMTLRGCLDGRLFLRITFLLLLASSTVRSIPVVTNSNSANTSPKPGVLRKPKPDKNCAIGPAPTSVTGKECLEIKGTGFIVPGDTTCHAQGIGERFAATIGMCYGYNKKVQKKVDEQQAGKCSRVAIRYKKLTAKDCAGAGGIGWASAKGEGKWEGCIGIEQMRKTEGLEVGYCFGAKSKIVKSMLGVCKTNFFGSLGMQKMTGPQCAQMGGKGFMMIGETLRIQQEQNQRVQNPGAVLPNRIRTSGERPSIEQAHHVHDHGIHHGGSAHLMVSPAPWLLNPQGGPHMNTHHRLSTDTNTPSVIGSSLGGDNWSTQSITGSSIHNFHPREEEAVAKGKCMNKEEMAKQPPNLFGICYGAKKLPVRTGK